MYAKSSAPDDRWRGFRVSENLEKAGIEIRFPITPPDNIREQLGKKGQGFRFTESNDDPRWYAAATPGRWVWVRELAYQNAPYGAIVDDGEAPVASAPATSAPAAGNSYYRSRHRGGRRQSSQATQAAPVASAPAVSNVTPIHSAPPPKFQISNSIAPTPTQPTPIKPTGTDMNTFDELMSLIGDPDDLLKWAEDMIANDWRSAVKELAMARNPKAFNIRAAIAQIMADSAVSSSLIQLAMVREAAEVAKLMQQKQSPQVATAQTTAPPVVAPVTPPIAPPPPPPDLVAVPAAVVEADASKKALRGNPRTRVVLHSRRSRVSPSPSAPTTSSASVKPRTDSGTSNPSRIGQPQQRANAPTLNERPIIHGQCIILGDDALTDTERYIGCYAVLGKRLGLSFKGLRMPISFRAHGDIYEAQPGTFQPLRASPALVERMQALIWLWDSWQFLLRWEQDDSIADGLLHTHRQAFNRHYDEFVAKHGTISHNAKHLQFEGMQDPRLTALLSLEQDGQKAAAIFTTRTHFPKRDLSSKRYDEVTDDHLTAALTLSLAEYGEVKTEAIARWFGITPEQAETALIEAGLCCLEPIFPEAQGHRSFIAEIDEYVEQPKVNAKGHNHHSS